MHHGLITPCNSGQIGSMAGSSKTRHLIAHEKGQRTNLGQKAVQCDQRFKTRTHRVLWPAGNQSFLQLIYTVHNFLQLIYTVHNFLQLTLVHNFLQLTLVHNFLQLTLAYNFLQLTLVHNFLQLTLVDLPGVSGPLLSPPLPCSRWLA